MHANEGILSIPEDLRKFSPFLDTTNKGRPANADSEEEAISENREGGGLAVEAHDNHLHQQENFDLESSPAIDVHSGGSTTGSEENRKGSIDGSSFPSYEGEVELLEEFDNELDFILAAELIGGAALDGEAPASNIYGEEGGGRLTLKTDPPSSDIENINSFRKIPVHRETKKAWVALVAAARAAGHKHPLLLPTSGYRSTARQAELWKKALAKYGTETEARKWVAKPGGSAHHSGRALDFYLGTKNNKESVALQRQTAVYKWLQENAPTFGFYPYQREPWHWEHNPLPNLGKPAAVISDTSAPGDLSQFSKATRLNRKYAIETGWIKFYSEINDLLLKTIGGENLSLGEEAFAEAVAVWQKKNGFTGKQADGIIGPLTWKKMKTQLSLNVNR